MTSAYALPSLLDHFGMRVVRRFARQVPKEQGKTAKAPHSYYAGLGVTRVVPNLLGSNSGFGGTAMRTGHKQRMSRFHARFARTDVQLLST